MFVWKDKNKWKRGRDGPLFKKILDVKTSESSSDVFDLDIFL